MLPFDSRLHLASGVDLTKSVDDVVALLKQNVPQAETVSHVFFTAYIETNDYPSLVRINENIVETAIKAVDRLAGENYLQYVILQTGGKAYGVEFVREGVTIPAPLKESLPRVPSPQGDKIFYYAQYDAVARLSEGKRWTFTEVRPDVIVGFTPGSNFMNAAQGLAFYLTLYKEVNGLGAECPFVGSEASWKNKHTDTSQDVLARTEIYAALNAEKCGSGRSFNSSDGPVVTWQEKWPRICDYFGLKGLGPSTVANSGQPVSVAKFAQQHKALWDNLAEKHALKKGIFERYSWNFIDGVCIAFDFDRQYDMSALRLAGFTEEVDTVRETFILAFERMRKGKIIP